MLTYRNDELHPSHQLHPFLAELERGYRTAQRYGTFRRYGGPCLMIAGPSQVSLGHWGEAKQILAHVFDLDLPPKTRAQALPGGALLRIRRGDLDLACADLDQAVTPARETDPQYIASTASLRAHAAVWAGGAADAHAAVAEALAVVANFQLPAHVIDLRRYGLGAEADLAEQARSGQDHTALATATNHANHLL